LENTKKYEDKYEQIIREKLEQLCKNKKCHIFLFGSRARNKSRKGSDFDIGIQGLSEEEFHTISIKFHEFLDESIVPYDVDLVDFDKATFDFKKEAARKIISWKTG